MDVLYKYREIMSRKPINFFCYDVPNINYLLECGYVDILDEIVENNKLDYLLKLGLKIPYNIAINSILVKKLINTFDIVNYRRTLEALSINNFCIVELIESKMHERYDDMFNDLNSEGILGCFQEFYNDFDKGIFDPNKSSLYSELYRSFSEIKKSNFYYLGQSEKILKEKTNAFLLSCISDKYFGEFSQNLLINIKSIVKLNERRVLIPIERLKIYNMILNFNNLSVFDKKNLYSLLDVKYKEYLYDDFRLCRDFLYDLYNDSFFKLDGMDYAIVDGIKVYKLEGQDFYIPIHMTGISRIKGNIDNIWKDDLSNTRIRSLSLSIISHKSLSTYHSFEKFVGFGFNRIPKEQIWHVCPWDSYSSGCDEISSVNVLYDLEELINKSSVYNELVVTENEEVIKPSYLVCRDKIDNFDYDIAKKLNVPIVLIDSNRYDIVTKCGTCSNIFLKNNNKCYVLINGK